MKYLLLLLLGIVFIGCKERGEDHKGLCVRCPDTCGVVITNGINFEDSWKATIACDCGEGEIWKTRDTTLTIDTTSGLDYNLETSDMPLRVPVGSGIKLGGIIQYNTAIDDTTLKSVWTDGVQLSPKSSKQFDKDTIYIYRDTCATDYNKPGEFQIELHENLNTKNK